MGGGGGLESGKLKSAQNLYSRIRIDARLIKYGSVMVTRHNLHTNSTILSRSCAVFGSFQKMMTK